MHRILFAAALAGLIVTGCQESLPPRSTGSAEAAPASFNVEGNPTTTFEIPGIQCEGCCQNARDALAKVPGVVDVHANHVDKRVVVAVDDAYFDAAAAQAALEEVFGDGGVLTDQPAEGISAK